MTRFIPEVTCVAICSATLLLSACSPEDTGSGLNRTVDKLPVRASQKTIPIADSGSLASEAERDIQAVHHLPLERGIAAALAVPAPLQARLQTGIQTGLQSRPLHDKLPVLQDSRERYAQSSRNATVQTGLQPVSTFSVDVDTGSYSNVRRFLQDGSLPPTEAVRVEELLNYFSYDYAQADSEEEPFSVTTELGPTPWNDKTHLLHVGLKGYIPATANTADANLVFLVDVSGSMNSPDKLGLLKTSISLLAHELDENDTVGIVVYAGTSGVALEPTPGNRHQAIDRALARLAASGSTNGAQGIELAYQLASEHFIEGGVNRVILATDGDFNVGLSDVNALKALIRKKRESGIALTTLGFGSGNYNDHLMEQLADVGNGSHAYIDTLGEARKVLVDELQATLLTIASDVKIQIEFNPVVVSEYRLIGYSNRTLANEDFSNDRVDAGDIGAGHTVTALYEIALHGEGGERHSPSRYGRWAVNSDVNPALLPHPPSDPQSEQQGKDDPREREVAELRLRYKLPGASTSRLIPHVISLAKRQDPPSDTTSNTTSNTTSDDFRFSASVAAFGQLLQGDERLASFGLQDARQLAARSLGRDEHGYRAEFIRLVDIAASLDRFSRLEAESRSHDEG